MEKQEVLDAMGLQLKEFKTTLDTEAKKEKDELQAKYDDLKKELDITADHAAKLDVKLQGFKNEPVKTYDFKGAFGKSVEDQAEQIKSLSGLGSGSRGKIDLKLNLSEATGQKDIGFSAGLYDRITTDYNFMPGVYATPFAPVWLRNILTNVPVDSKSVDYVQENLATNDSTGGAADIWDGDPVIASLTAKPEVLFNFEDATASVEWIAATTRVKRETLMDVGFLSSYIPQQLVFGRRGILVRENALITSVLDANSTAYDNRKSIAVEQIYDAAFGQIKDYYFNATHILMNHRDVVDLILNKATGSGEYDLPVGTVSFSAGQLTIGGIPVLGLPQITPGDWYVMDNTQVYFLNRMSTEVRMFEEDRDNVIKNLVTFRAEERAGALVLSDAAVIKGSSDS